MSTMASTRWLLLVLCVLDAHDDASVVQMGRSEQADMGAENNRNTPSNDTGHAHICGPENVTFEFSWRPRVVSQAGEVLIDANFIAPIPFNNGTLSGDVYVPFVKSMIFEYNYPITCDKNLHHLGIACPVKKGQRFKVHGISAKMKSMPVGKFEIRGKLKNEKGELFVWFSIDLEIKD